MQMQVLKLPSYLDHNPQTSDENQQCYDDAMLYQKKTPTGRLASKCRATT